MPRGYGEPGSQLRLLLLVWTEVAIGPLRHCSYRPIDGRKVDERWRKVSVAIQWSKRHIQRYGK